MSDLADFRDEVRLFQQLSVTVAAGQNDFEVFRNLGKQLQDAIRANEVARCRGKDLVQDDEIETPRKDGLPGLLDSTLGFASVGFPRSKTERPIRAHSFHARNEEGNAEPLENGELVMPVGAASLVETKKENPKTSSKSPYQESKRGGGFPLAIPGVGVDHAIRSRG